MSGGIVILGAGPTGLGAAYRLVERGETGFEIFERAGQVGGLATSFTDPKGWTWDVSGHIIFSGYKYFNDFLAKVLGSDGIRWIDRESWIKFEDKYVRYPFQNHLSSLPEQAMLECLIGLVESQTISKDQAFTNFEEWVLAKFGAGVAKHFMNPYNFKVWATPLAKMGYYWIAERVSVVDWRKAIETTLVPKSTDWGPNAKFGYPARGGTLGLWKAVLPFVGDRVRFHKRVVSIDEEKREVTFADGSTRAYDRLLSTMPLDALVARLDARARDRARPRRRSSSSTASSRSASASSGPRPRTRTGSTSRTSTTPFYRMTYLSNYSPQIVPGGDTSRYFSVLTETSYSKFKPLPEGRFRKGGRGRARGRGDPAAFGPPAHRDGLPDPRRPLLPDPVDRPEPRARHHPRLPRAARHLLARPVRVLEVRDRQPGPLAHAGRRARRPLAGRERGESLSELTLRDSASEIRARSRILEGKFVGKIERRSSMKRPSRVLGAFSVCLTLAAGSMLAQQSKEEASEPVPPPDRIPLSRSPDAPAAASRTRKENLLRTRMASTP